MTRPACRHRRSPSRPRPRRVRLGLLLAAAGALSVAACREGPPEPPSAPGTPTEAAVVQPPDPSSSPRAAAAARGLELLSSDAAPEHPHLLLFLGVLHRRFGVESLEGVLARYDAASEGYDVPNLDVLRRVLTEEAAVTRATLSSLSSGTDRIVGPALHCDRLGLPERWVARAWSDARAGGYQLTHVALALMALDANGCAGRIPTRLRRLVVDSLAGIVEEWEADGQVSDLELEAATFLWSLREGDRVPEAFLDAVVAAQRPDGGWPDPVRDQDGRTSWHATALATWLLLEAETEGVPKPTFVPQLESRAFGPVAPG